MRERFIGPAPDLVVRRSPLARVRSRARDRWQRTAVSHLVHDSSFFLFQLWFEASRWALVLRSSWKSNKNNICNSSNNSSIDNNFVVSSSDRKKIKTGKKTQLSYFCQSTLKYLPSVIKIKNAACPEAGCLVQRSKVCLEWFENSVKDLEEWSWRNRGQFLSVSPYSSASCSLYPVVWHTTPTNGLCRSKTRPPRNGWPEIQIA